MPGRTQGEEGGGRRHIVGGEIGYRKENIRLTKNEDEDDQSEIGNGTATVWRAPGRKQNSRRRQEGESRAGT